MDMAMRPPDERELALAASLARRGMDESAIAAGLGMSRAALRRRRARWPTLAAALAETGDGADAQVEGALLRRALGYTVEEEKLEVDAEGEVRKRQVATKHIEPNLSAIVYWLKNRRPDIWKDRPEDTREPEPLRAAREALDGVESGF